MRLSLMRHGIAEDQSTTDFDRALTPEGCEQVTHVVRALRASGWAPGSILHSPYVRTTETARIVRAFFPTVPFQDLEELAIGSLDGVIRACARFHDPLLVGHEPTMGNLCGRLIGAPSGSIRFDRAGFALLDLDRLPTTRPARLLVYVSPEWLKQPLTH